MKLKYYGTAAFEGIPSIFCRCSVCERARAAGGRNLQSRSQALVDDTLLIDFPPDTVFHVFHMGLPLHKINHCLITHAHADHFFPADIESRNSYVGLCHNNPNRFTLYGTRPVYQAYQWLEKKCGFDREDSPVVFRIIKPFESFQVEGYCITPLLADHDQSAGSVIFLIEKDGKIILWGHDTGVFPQESWDYLNEHKPFLNVVSLDCTLGGRDCEKGHMGFPNCREVFERLKTMYCVNETSIGVVSHFSHNGRWIYDDATQVARAAKFLAAYDGMQIDF